MTGEAPERETYASASDRGGALIDFDYACAACDYNLRGLRVGAVCPECGARILRIVRREWLSAQPMSLVRRYSIGSTSLAASVLVPFIAALFIAIARSRTDVFVALLSTSNVLWLVAAWLMTPPLDSRDAMRLGLHRRAPVRIMARWAQVVMPTAVVVWLWELDPRIWGGLDPYPWLVCVLISQVGIVCFIIVLARLCRWCEQEGAAFLLQMGAILLGASSVSMVAIWTLSGSREIQADFGMFFVLSVGWCFAGVWIAVLNISRARAEARARVAYASEKGE